ncbi:uncharacterized protein LOC127836457 [Dreissena polymorpha]|uniref:uncharacterized protein LOC127836457 n=1 Tax=Dreissena polymorpha TaxID=45954 RepID=UPI002264EAC0|nr:uncharacterized protein LOC127836457 [Dreissena polymorpha]
MIVFKCDFSQNRGVRAVWNDIDRARTEVEYPPSQVNKSDILCRKNDTNFVLTCESDNVTRATCSNNGKITLKLKTTTGFEPYSTSFAMNLQEKSIRASSPIANNVSESTVFSVRCSVSGVCKSYKMHIYAYETYTKKTRIDGSKFNCESSFNNTNGHTLACNDEIKGDDIRKGKTKITCALVDGMNESTEQETEIQFPKCCEKKNKSDPNCTCPYCNTDKWCRAYSKALITDTNSTLKCDTNC